MKKWLYNQENIGVFGDFSFIDRNPGDFGGNDGTDKVDFLFLTRQIPDEYIEQLASVKNESCCYKRSQYTLGLVDLIYEFKLIMYRLTEYSKTQGILLITEVIHISNSTEIPFKSMFKRQVDPFMHVSQIKLDHWTVTTEED